MKFVSTIFLLLFIINIHSSSSGVKEFPDDSGSDSQLLKFGLSADYNTKYVWRGFAFSKGSVIQPSAWVIYNKINLSFWSNFDLKPEENNHHFNEFDITASYPLDVWKLEIEPSFQFYTYPNVENLKSTIELGMKISYPFKFITLYSSHNFDIKNYTGSYYGELGINYEKELSGKFSAGCSSGFGWSSAKFNEAYAGVHTPGLNAVFLYLYGNYEFFSSIYFKPRLEFSSILNRQIREASGNDYIINFGISLSREF